MAKGDKFVPFGMTGKKNVSDYLTDRKFSLFEKENQYVVCSDEKIIWLVGERSDNRFRITNTTKRVMIIRLQKSDKHPISHTRFINFLFKCGLHKE